MAASSGWLPTTEMLTGYWKSRVARRLFVLFLAVTLAPVLLLGGFSYIQVRSHLEEAGRHRLQQASKDYGMRVVGRLAERADLLRASDGERLAAGDIEPMINRYFTRFDWQWAGEVELNAEQHSRLSDGEIVLLLRAGGNPVMLLPRPGETLLLQAELDPAKLWLDDGFMYPHCILDGRSEPLFCSAGAQDLELDLEVLRGRHAGVFDWSSGGQQFYVGFWRALLQSAYASPGFQVVSFQPRREVLAALAHFHRFFPAVLLLALALSGWLAMRQIQAQMRPLDSLAGAASRLAEGDFEATLLLDDDDEFGDVARTFHAMRGRLRLKFRLLEMLAELDRQILSAAPIQSLLETILRDGPGALGCDLVGVLRTEDAGGDLRFGLTCRLAEDALAQPETWHPPDAVDMTASADEAGVVELSGAAVTHGPLGEVAGLGIARFWVFPALAENSPTAALVVGFREPPKHVDDLRVAGRGIADRLVVARSSFAQEEKLYRNAHYDALTQLPNRTLLRDRVEQAIERARHNRTAVALLLLDLDRFKEINDGLGHVMGDRLLVAVAERLSRGLKEGETVARLGGDEFAILLPDKPRSSHAAEAAARAEDILALLAPPVSLDAHTASAEASVGIALFPDNGATFDGLLKGADSAMYASKEKNRGSYQFCSADINTRAQQRFIKVQQLRLALERGEFLLHYQPKVSTRTGQIVGAEALLRWRSDGVLVLPGEFIELVEEIGISPQLGDWVLQTACAQLAAWDRSGLAPLGISVNVFPSQFLDPGFSESVASALAQSGLDASRLELEILEQTALDASTATLDTLLGFRKRGIDIALDDFGTGYSSLVYLTRIPANVLKLDRAFIRSMAEDARQAAIVGGIIALGHRLGMRIVAEGVEEDAQRRLLADLDCDLIQGYLYSRPLPPEEFVQLLDRRVAVSA